MAKSVAKKSVDTRCEEVFATVSKQHISVRQALLKVKPKLYSSQYYARSIPRKRPGTKEKERSGSDKVTHPSGATRMNDIGPVRYDLISPFGEERLAALYGKGAETHGERNWEQGMPISDVINRMKRHINQYMRGDRTEDFMAKVSWAAYAIMEFDATHPECMDIPRRG